MFEILPDKENFFHYENSLKDNCGSLIVVQRPGNGTNTHTTDYMPCKNCLGFLPYKIVQSSNFK